MPSRRTLAGASFLLVAAVCGSGAYVTRGSAQTAALSPRFRALVFSKVTNYYHQSIPAGIEAIRKLGREHSTI